MIDNSLGFLMTTELAVVLALLGAAIAMFAINQPRMDAVALIMLVALPLTGSVTTAESLAGFSDANIVLIAALFVIGDGLVRTGVARGLGDWLAAKAGSNEARLTALLMLVVCTLGAFMSSTAVTAIFIPVALRIAQSTGSAPGRLMMPLSMAALISGMTTLIATAPNLVVSGELERRGHEGFSFFAFAPFGVPILALSIGYMYFARRWLGKKSASHQSAQGPRLADWIDKYELAQREHRLRVTGPSPLVGQSVRKIREGAGTDASLIAIERGKLLIQPTANTVVESGDILFVDWFAPEETVEQLQREYRLAPLPLSGRYFSDRSQEIGMAEVLVPATSALVGNTVVNANFCDEHGLRVIGRRQGRDTVPSTLTSQPLGVGDTLLVVGTWRAIRNLQLNGKDLVVIQVPVEIEDVLPAPGKAWHAVACLVLVVGLMVSGLIPNVLAALLGCLLMGALGITDLSSAYRSIDWKTLVLIVGMLPFSIALQRTGGVDLVADGLLAVVGGAGPRLVLMCLFAITAILGMFISNTATAVLMAPVALAMAHDLSISPYPFAMIVALAASTAFMTPVSSPVNTLVVTPGDYTFGDFLRVGIPFAVVVMIVCVVMAPLIFPF